jgi:tetratricopeptide (TPR) repeat protein
MTQLPAQTETPCCHSMDLQWTQRIIDSQYADVNFCASCGHVHRTEKYSVSLRFPSGDRCVNCGGDLTVQVTTGPFKGPDPTEVFCGDCGLTDAANKLLHDRLASLLPDGGYLAAPEALAEHHRLVLALKLATAETRWGQDPVAGEIQRLEVLEAMNEFDRALDEGYEWSEREGCPPVVWGTIAQIEASSGDIGRALSALERGLSLLPERTDWWLDYAELNVHLDDRPNAVRAAAKALHDPHSEAGALTVLAEVGERYYANGLYAEALSACSVANDKQERHVGLAWLRARIAAANQDASYLVRWLETTVALEPEHVQANEMLAPYKRKKGWFTW